MDRVCLISSDEEDVDGNFGNLPVLKPTKSVLPEVIYLSENPSCFQSEDEEITDRIIPLVNHQEPTKEISHVKREMQENAQSSEYGELVGAGKGIKREVTVEENSTTFISKRIKIETPNEMDTIDSTLQTKRESKLLPKPEPDGNAVLLPKLTTLVTFEPKAILNEQSRLNINENDLKSNTTTSLLLKNSSTHPQPHTESNKNSNQDSDDASSSTTLKRPNTATTTLNAKKIKYDRQATPICDAIMKEYSRRQKLLKMRGSKASPDLSDMPIQEILNKAKNNQDQNKKSNVVTTKPARVISETSNIKEPLAEKYKDSLESEQKDPLAIVPKVEVDLKPNIASINVENTQTPEVSTAEIASATVNLTRRGRGRPRRRYSEDDPPYKPGIKLTSSKPVNKIVKQPIITSQNKLESPKCDAIMKEYARKQRLLKMQGNKASTNTSNVLNQDILNKTSDKQASKTTTDEFKTRTVITRGSTSNRQEPSSSEDNDPRAVVSDDEVVSNNIEKSLTPSPSTDNANATICRGLSSRRGRGQRRTRYSDNDPLYKPGSTSSQQSNKIIKPSTVLSKNKLESTDSDRSKELKFDMETQKTCRGRQHSGKYYEDPPYKATTKSKSTHIMCKNKPDSTKTDRGLTSVLQVILTPLEKDSKINQKILREEGISTKSFDNGTGESKLLTNSKRTARKSFPSSKNKSDQVNRLKSQLQLVASEKNMNIKESASSSSDKNIESLRPNVNTSSPEALNVATRLKSIAEKITEKLSNEPSSNIDHETLKLCQTAEELLKLQKEQSNSNSASLDSIHKQIKQELPDELSQGGSYDTPGLPITSASPQNSLHNQYRNSSIVTGTISDGDKYTFLMDYLTSFIEVFHPKIYEEVIPTMAEILMICMDNLQECLQRIRNAESVTMDEIRNQEVVLANKAYLKVVTAFGEKFFHNFDLVANNIAITKTAKALMITFVFFLTCSLFTKAPKYSGQTHRVRSVLVLISKIHKYEHPLVWEVLQAPDQMYEEELKTVVQILKYFQKRKLVTIPDYKLFTNWLENCDQESVHPTDIFLMNRLASELAGCSKSVVQQRSSSIQFPNSTPSKLPKIAAEFVETLQSERACNAKRIEGKLDDILSFLSVNQEPSHFQKSEPRISNSGTIELSSSLSAGSSSQFYNNQQVRNVELFTQEEDKGLTQLTGLNSLCASYTRKIKSEPLDTSGTYPQYTEAPVGDGSTLQTSLPLVKEEPIEISYSDQPNFAPFNTIESLQPTESIFYSEFVEEPTSLKSEGLDFK